jgi:AraC family transcriptional regulator
MILLRKQIGAAAVIDWFPQQAGYILHEYGTSFTAEGSGWLSVKSFFQGKASYQVGRGQYVVDDSCYLVLNHGQQYQIQIESEIPVESFCIFFAPTFVASVTASLTTSVAKGLDTPEPGQAMLPQFVERIYQHDQLLSPRLMQLRSLYRQRQRLASAALLEYAHEAIAQLLHVYDSDLQAMDILPALRPATRNELYRRLYLAKDYADACFSTPVTLTTLADIAGLSPNHLLRTFKQLFGQSPYQYLTSQRLHHAQHLLRTTHQPVSEICCAIGFESLGSFSWLFRQRFGCSPKAYRQQFR